MSSFLKLFNGFSYKEKSILISLLAVTVLYGNYFYDLLRGAVEQSMEAMLGNMAVLVVALIIVHVVFHIVISLDDVDEAEDERDKAVARRAAVFGYNVLFVAVLIVISRIVILGAFEDAGSNTGTETGTDTRIDIAIDNGIAAAAEAGTRGMDGDARLAPPDSFEITNLLLAGLILSEMVYYAAQLFFYRWGVRA